MGSRLKIGLGTALLAFSAFYLLIIIVMMSEAKQGAAYKVDSFLEFEYEGCEKVEGEAETEGESWRAAEGYSLYCVYLTVRNQSSVEYYVNPEEALTWSYNCYTMEPDNPYDYNDFFYEAGTPGLPGKAEAKIQVYVQVEEGAKSVTACYYPNWEEEKVELEIPLNSS